MWICDIFKLSERDRHGLESRVLGLRLLFEELWGGKLMLLSASNLNIKSAFFKPTALWNIGIDCPSSKGNHGPTQKFERPYGKNTKSKIFLKSVQNLCPLSHSKALWSEFFEDLNRIKTNQNKWKSMTFLIISHLKPKTLLYKVEFFIYINFKCSNSWLENI